MDLCLQNVEQRAGDHNFRAVDPESRDFYLKKSPEFAHKAGIHELIVLRLALVHNVKRHRRSSLPRSV